MKTLLISLFAAALLLGTGHVAQALESGENGPVPDADVAADDGYIRLRMPDHLTAPPRLNLGDADAAPAESPESKDSLLHLNGRIGTFDDRLPENASSGVGYGAAASSLYGFGPGGPSLLRQPSMGAPASAATAGGDALGIGYFTPRYAGVRFGIGGDAAASDLDKRRRLGVSLSSTYFSGGFGAGDPLIVDMSAPAGNTRAYNVGLNIGFAGFSLGASYLKGDRDAALDYQGYDLGLSYAGRAWATRLQVAQVTQRREDNLLLGGLDANKVYSLEFGASYTFNLGITLAGRFQYYDFRSSFLQDDPNDAQVLFLGTDLNF